MTGIYSDSSILIGAAKIVEKAIEELEALVAPWIQSESAAQIDDTQRLEGALCALFQATVPVAAHRAMGVALPANPSEWGVGDAHLMAIARALGIAMGMVNITVDKLDKISARIAIEVAETMRSNRLDNIANPPRKGPTN